MHYRLLRNNKESGPFTTLELKEMGLKPYDLLWTEGRGAAWQYASEISELKDFAPTVEEQPFDRFYKEKETLQTTAQSSVAIKKVKPRYRISNGKLIMVEAGNMEVGTNGVIKETAPAARSISPVLPSENKPVETQDWQDVYPQWQPQQKKEVKTEPPVEVETKYSESLDDLKKRYAEKVLGDKKEKTSSSLSSASVKQNIMAVVALVVLMAGGYIGYTLKKKDTGVTNGQPVVERADIAANNTEGTQPVANNNSSAEDNTVTGGEDNSAQNNAPSKSSVSKVATTPNMTTQSNSKPLVVSGSAGKESGNKTTAVVPQKQGLETLAKVNTAADKMNNKPVAIAAKTTAKPDNNAVLKTSPGSEKNNTASSSPLPALPVAKSAAKQIGDYVSVKKLGGSGTGVQNIKLMVSNVSDFPIDLAVVDIQYFDSKGKYQKGETMYVKDINGGNNVEVRVPDSDKASSIKYKISMVQADQKTLYMVAD